MINLLLSNLHNHICVWYPRPFPTSCACRQAELQRSAKMARETVSEMSSWGGPFSQQQSVSTNLFGLFTSQSRFHVWYTVYLYTTRKFSSFDCAPYQLEVKANDGKANILSPITFTSGQPHQQICR